ncbi:MAG: cytochrome PufQ [Pseudomonadota bacterium]
MTDHTAVDVPHTLADTTETLVRHKPPRREFFAYFALIFLATLPLAFVTWTLSAARQMRLPERDPFSKAWSQARIITPMIFHP